MRTMLAVCLAASLTSCAGARHPQTAPAVCAKALDAADQDASAMRRAPRAIQNAIDAVVKGDQHALDAALDDVIPEVDTFLRLEPACLAANPSQACRNALDAVHEAGAVERPFLAVAKRAVNTVARDRTHASVERASTSEAAGKLVAILDRFDALAYKCRTGSAPPSATTTSTTSLPPCSTTCSGLHVPLKALEAFDVCKQFVSDRLKAPSGATWRDPTGDKVTYSGSDDGPWSVAASVDSENSFGAKLRSTYICTVLHKSGDDWSLVHLEFNDGGALP
jgi:hypothetical protein